MAIEFSCSECGKLISLSDETVGMSDRCAECGGAVTVAPVSPAGVSQRAASGGGTQPSASDESCAGPCSSISTPQPQRTFPSAAGESSQKNPYAPSVTNEMSAADRPVAKKEICHRTFSIRQLLGDTWAVFSDQLPMCALVSITLAGFTVPAGVVGFILSEMALKDTDDVLPVLIPLGLFGFTVYCLLLLGQAILMIKLCRGERAKLGDLFSGGPYLWRGMGLTLLVYLIQIAVSVACLLPAMVIQGPFVDLACRIVANVANYIIGLMLFLCIYLIVDRDVGVLASIAQSARYMYGNKFRLFVAQLLAGAGCLAFLLVTFSLGIFLVVPYCMLFSAMVYVLATGQQTAVDRVDTMLARIRR